MSTSVPSDVAPIVIYGASWCPDCRRAKQFLASHRIAYKWIDLETEPDQVAEVEARNDGKRIIPTIVFPDGSFLAEPSNDELADRIGLSRAGDVRAGSTKQIASAVGEGAAAAIQIRYFLEKFQEMVALHS